MSGLPYQGGMNNYMFDTSQYGVNMSYDSSAQDLKTMGSLVSIIPYVGPILGALANFGSTVYQNRQQEYFYNKYMSPAARMAQMRAAGINSNAAAEGIAGSSAPQMTAATPNNAFGALGEALGNSANTALTADVLHSEARKNNSEAGLNDSLNTEKTITNKYLDRMQSAALNKLRQEGRIDESTANMLAVDEAYKPATAYANYSQLMLNLGKTATELELLSANIVHEYAAAYQAMMAASLSEAQIHKVFSDIGVNNAMIEKISHECNEIDARTAATYQEINESTARTTLIGIQTKFQQDYYDIWQNTGFNWNSDVEKSIVGAWANMHQDEATRMQKGLKQYIRSLGDARSESKDYTFDKLIDIYGHLTRLGLGAGVGN